MSLTSREGKNSAELRTFIAFSKKLIRPKITGTQPFCNYTRYLLMRINSFPSQTLPVSGIIYLDDASTGNSLDLTHELLEVAKVEPRFAANEVNSGSPSAQKDDLEGLLFSRFQTEFYKLNKPPYKGHA